MERVYPALLACSLFKGFTEEGLEAVAARVRFDVREYARGAVIAVEEEPCAAIGIVVAGGVHVQRLYPSGKSLTIDTLAAGSSFGEAVVFSDVATYPATIVASQDAAVVYLARQDVVALCRESPVFLVNFMHLLSNKILMLNQKIKGLSYTTVRQKVAHFILEQSRKRGTDTLELEVSRGEMAESLGIPQPSLSRELIALREEGWIDFQRRTITIRDRAMLELSLAS